MDLCLPRLRALYPSAEQMAVRILYSYGMDNRACGRVAHLSADRFAACWRSFTSFAWHLCTGCSDSITILFQLKSYINIYKQMQVVVFTLEIIYIYPKKRIVIGGLTHALAYFWMSPASVTHPTESKKDNPIEGFPGKVYKNLW